MIKKLILIVSLIILIVISLEVVSKIIVSKGAVKIDDSLSLFYQGPTVSLPKIPKKRPGVFRIFIYGGSTTVGVHMPKVGYVEQLKLQLVSLIKMPVEIFNLGFSGFTSTDDRFLVDRTINSRPDLIIIYTSHNEFLRFQPLPYYSYILQKLNFAVFPKIIAYFTQKIVNKSPEFDTDVTSVDNTVRQEILKVFEDNMRAIIRKGSSKKVPTLLVTAVSNISDWPPVKESDGAYFYYRRGQINEKLANFEEAKKDYQLAKDLDIKPWRVLSSMNQFVRQLADKKYIYVADAEKYFEKLSPNGLVGNELIVDNVHPSTLGKYYLTLAILETLKKNQIIPSNEWRNKDPLSLNEVVSHLQITSEDRFQELLAVAKYCLKPPFFNYDCAESTLNEAELIDKSDWILWANKATLSLARNNLNKAGEELKEAFKLRRSKISLKDYNNIPTLEYLLINNYANQSQVLGAFIERE